MRHDTITVGGDFHPRPDRDILHLRSAFPSGSLNRREVQFFLAGQALSHIDTPKLTTFHEKSGLTPDRVTRDADALLDYLASRPQVIGDRFGVCGYCMGGRMSVVVAGRLPDRVAAAAAFHPGGLVTDNPDSPHLLADRISATVYIGGAENDPSFTADHAEKLDKAFSVACVPHRIECYPAAHGFAVPDNPSYDAAADERHWAAMTETFGAALN
ncbi:dienelactone hydrolase family protein [Mycobacterium canetti]|uniref:dienelactone hydrolase family protein n=1 Tax=Mycobacterium canetti TaxID=78331 RepID=UPI00399D6FB0